MLSKRRRIRGDADIPSGSMADVVFLLLIFFLVTTTMNKDKGLGLVLPPPGEAKEIPKKNICNVLVNASGNVLIDDQAMSIRGVYKEIKKRITENPNLIVSVKASEDTEYNYFIQVLDQIKKTGCDKISIANYEK